jgi:hypothetical protein
LHPNLVVSIRLEIPNNSTAITSRMRRNNTAYRKAGYFTTAYRDDATPATVIKPIKEK